MNALLLIYAIGCGMNITMLHKDLVDAWSSRVPKPFIVLVWIIAVSMSWLYLIVQYRMNRNNR
jgi:hypothetical protein